MTRRDSSKPSRGLSLWSIAIIGTMAGSPLGLTTARAGTVPAIEVMTSRGCGDQAVFASGELLEFSVRLLEMIDQPNVTFQVLMTMSTGQRFSFSGSLSNAVPEMTFSGSRQTVPVPPVSGPGSISAHLVAQGAPAVTCSFITSTEATPRPTGTVTPTRTATATGGSPATRTATVTPTLAATAAPTFTPSSSPTSTVTQMNTATQTMTPSIEQRSPTPSAAPTRSPPPPSPPVSATASPTATAQPVQGDGDANCDSRITAADVASYAVLIATQTHAPCGRDDINGNGVADALDLRAAISAIFGTAARR